MDAIFPAANSNTVKLFYSKRNSSTELRMSALGRQTMWNGSSSSTHPPPCNDKFEIGAFYEIDHEKLPPKSPIQLKALRIVKVKERRKMDLTVSFPSTYSLRKYFSATSACERTPELDEKFVMSYSYAERILRRKIPASQLDTDRHQQIFWLVDPSVLSEESEAEDEEKPPASGCLMMLKSSGLLEWGVRRRVKYIGRHRGTTPPPFPVSPGEEEEEDEEMAVGDQEEEKESSGGRKRTRGECKKEIIEKTKLKKVGRKNKKKKKKMMGKIKKKARLDIVNVNNNNPDDVSRRERWSTERYESAELKLLNIMGEKGAVIGNPILRQELRVEARKHIGDTGLLDHLLKHMAGKVIAQGSDRFRRRHNAEGAMEYWLEPAELMEIRKEADVKDPYWVPPPGWKIGDATSLCSCGAECKKERNRLSEELEIIKRDVDQLRSLKQQVEMEGRDAKAAAKADTGILQEKYEKVLKMNAKMEAEMAGFVNSMEALKEEVKLLKDKAPMEVVMEEAAAIDKKMIPEPNNSSTNTTITADDKINGINGTVSNEHNILMVPAGKKVQAVGGGGGGGGGRRSGFRICKPQGTFLWPNMGSRGGGAQPQGIQLQVVPTNNDNNNNNQNVSCTFVENHHHYHHQQQLMLFGGGAAAACGSGNPPTPPSATSTATSPPNHLLLPSPTTPTSMVPPPPPPHMPRASSSSSSMEKAGVANWKKQQEIGSSTIVTDLVLATPSLLP